ncbi:MAG TPA: YceI family protein [Candidatus Binataceae bacterium]|nr:YceI family protein [Candidatus Binataceae bacterium]
MRTIVSVAMLITLAALAPRAFADPVHLKIDPAASKVTAVVAEPDRTKGTATGKFNITSGEVSGDSANPAGGGSVSIVLDAGSYDSGNPFRDDAVIVLLDANTYTTITFQSTGLQNVAMSSASAGTATVAGNLTLHGTTRPVSIPINAALDAAGRLTADGALTFNYADYGVKVPSLLGMSAANEVTVTFHIVAVPAAAGS